MTLFAIRRSACCWSSRTSGAIAIGMVTILPCFFNDDRAFALMAGLLFILLTGGIVCGSCRGSLTPQPDDTSLSPSARLLQPCRVRLLSQVQRGHARRLHRRSMLLHGIGIGLAQQVPIVGVQNAAAKS